MKRSTMTLLAVIGLGCAVGACEARLGDIALAGGDPGDPNDPNGPDPDAGSGALSFQPSNIDEALLTRGADALVLQGDAAIDTDTGAIVVGGEDVRPAGVVFERVDRGQLPPLGVFAATDLVIGPGVTVRVQGAAALVFALSGDVSIDGVIQARGGRGAPQNAGPGGFAGGVPPDVVDGQGAGGGKFSPGPDDPGGGGGGHVAAGGAGGTFVNGSTVQAGGAGGAVTGEDTLVPLVGGAGGGLGGGDDFDGNGAGGGGGGAVQISALGEIAIAAGGIDAGGGGGQGGSLEDGGGGGGAGGAILLEAPSVVVTGVLAANGGGGGAGADIDVRGASGQPGQLSAQAASGGAPLGEGVAGGAGGAGEQAAGQPGVSSNIDQGTDNAGGGGGAGGRIRINGNAIAITGVISPAAGFTTGSVVLR